MKRLIFVTLLALPLSACGWWDGAFAPYYANPSSSYGNPYGQMQSVRGPGFYDRRTAKGQLAIEGGVGADFIASGKLVQGNQIVSMKDAYGTGTRYAVRATYPRAAEGRYFTASAYRSEFDGKAQVFTAPQIARQSGTLSDYTSQGVEFGLRQYSPQPSSLLGGIAHPYIEGRLGGAYVDDISLNQGVQRTALYNGGWVPTGAAMVGVEVPAYNRFTVGIETGLRYQGRLSAVNTATANSITGARSTGSLITVPLTLRGRYKF